MKCVIERLTKCMTGGMALSLVNRVMFLSIISLLPLYKMFFMIYHGTSFSSLNIHIAHSQCSHYSRTAFSEKKLLTIFTTFKDDPRRNFIQKNTIVNWASLGDAVQPIFFNNMSFPSNTLTFAIKKGWIGLPLQRINSYGTPFLKDMYQKAMLTTESYFYGFSNDDILFDNGLVNTLEGVLKGISQLMDNALIIGRRTNVDMNNYYAKLKTLNTSFWDFARSHGKLFLPDAMDYFFIYNPRRFPWHKIKEVVIGRPGIDNYLVGQALSCNVSVIDSTSSVFAIHQTGTDGNRAGFKNMDQKYNIRVLGNYLWSSGKTSNAQYQSVTDLQGRVFLLKRKRKTQKIYSNPEPNSHT